MNFPDLADLRFVRKLGGTTGPVLVEDVDGVKYVLKSTATGRVTAGHLRNEVAADKMYRNLDVDVPPSTLIEAPDGSTNRLSVYLEGGQELREWLKTATPKMKKQMFYKIQKGFVADALLANWDSIGLAQDNIIIKQGKPYRVDNGGALFYRAQGAPKGAAFSGNEIGEFKTLRTLTMNPRAHEVFNSILPEQIDDQIKNILANPNRIMKDVGAALGGMQTPEYQELRQKISGRLEHLLELEDVFERQLTPNKLKVDVDSETLKNLMMIAEDEDGQIGSYLSGYAKRLQHRMKLGDNEAVMEAKFFIDKVSKMEGKVPHSLRQVPLKQDTPLFRGFDRGFGPERDEKTLAELGIEDNRLLQVIQEKRKDPQAAVFDTMRQLAKEGDRRALASLVVMDAMHNTHAMRGGDTEFTFNEQQLRKILGDRYDGIYWKPISHGGELMDIRDGRFYTPDPSLADTYGKSGLLRLEKRRLNFDSLIQGNQLVEGILINPRMTVPVMKDLRLVFSSTRFDTKAEDWGLRRDEAEKRLLRQKIIAIDPDRSPRGFAPVYKFIVPIEEQLPTGKEMKALQRAAKSLKIDSSQIAKILKNPKFRAGFLAVALPFFQEDTEAGDVALAGVTALPWAGKEAIKHKDLNNFEIDVFRGDSSQPEPYPQKKKFKKALYLIGDHGEVGIRQMFLQELMSGNPAARKWNDGLSEIMGTADDWRSSEYFIQKMLKELGYDGVVFPAPSRSYGGVEVWDLDSGEFTATSKRYARDYSGGPTGMNADDARKNLSIEMHKRHNALWDAIAPTMPQQKELPLIRNADVIPFPTERTTGPKAEAAKKLNEKLRLGEAYKKNLPAPLDPDNPVDKSILDFFTQERADQREAVKEFMDAVDYRARRSNLSVVPDPIEITDDMFITDPPKWAEREATEEADRMMKQVKGRVGPKLARGGLGALTWADAITGGLDVGSDAPTREAMEMLGSLITGGPDPTAGPLTIDEIEAIEGVLGRSPQVGKMVQTEEEAEEGEQFREWEALGGGERAPKIVTETSEPWGPLDMFPAHQERLSANRLRKYKDYIGGDYKWDAHLKDWKPRTEIGGDEFERETWRNVRRSLGEKVPEAQVELGADWELKMEPEETWDEYEVLPKSKDPTILEPTIEAVPPPKKEGEHRLRNIWGEWMGDVK